MKRLVLAAAAALLFAAPAFADLEVGAKAPEFSAQGMKGGQAFTFKLSDALKTGPVVVYFFPAAYTQGCTVETKLFADAADDFKAAGATLVGLTAGARLADGTMAGASENLARLAEFSAEHCRDKFPIAAISKETIEGYKVTLSARPDWTERTSYVIGQDGKVALAYNDMKPNEHVSKTLEAVKAIKAAKKG
jgi:thioredoxin-dependent peroxiredoxin